MKKRVPLFGVIENEDLTLKKLEEEKQKVLNSRWDRDDKKNR